MPFAFSKRHSPLIFALCFAFILGCEAFPEKLSEDHFEPTGSDSQDTSTAENDATATDTNEALPDTTAPDTNEALFVCSGPDKLDCDDGNPCTSNVCDENSGCTNPPNDLPCDDGEFCTENDQCVNSICVAGGPRDCDDTNECTVDACEDSSCHNPPKEGPCHDGDLCTTDDTCVDGDCVPGMETLVCDDTNICTDDACVPEQGCIFPFAPGPCNDGDPCTNGDQCTDGEAGGYCAAGSLGLECDDGNPCTDNFCEPGIGCQTTPNNNPCDDELYCTQISVCSNGSCQALVLVVCSGLDAPCHVGVCDETADQCIDTVIPDTAPCDDNNPCTHTDACADGWCKGMEYECIDGLDCTANACTGDGNCALNIEDEKCVIDDACYQKGDPGGPCKICAPSTSQTSWSASVNDTPCVHEGLCVSGGTCFEGVCVGDEVVVCDEDSNPCELHFCDPSTGECATEVVEDGVPCDDGDLCTEDDTCDDGFCESGASKDCDDGVACTLDICVPGLAENCVHNPKNIACNDGNPCTTFICNSLTGCSYFDNSGECDDGDPCTFPDLCLEGLCTGTTVGGFSTCGNGVCDDDDMLTCPEECAAVGCDGFCGPNDAMLCPSDCSGAPPGQTCGDGLCQCEWQETCDSCPEDCGSCENIGQLSDGCTLSLQGGCNNCTCKNCVCIQSPECCNDAWMSECILLCIGCEGCDGAP